MKELGLIVADFLKGKSIYAPARRLLNLLFTLSITSFIYERTHGPFTWLDYHDYKGILDFFIKGRFFIPFSIFIIVHYTTLWLASITFTVINYFPSVRLTRSIINYEVKAASVKQYLGEVQQVSKKITPIELTPQLMQLLYEHLSTELKPADLETLRQESDKQKKLTETNFIFFVRAAIAITLYFASMAAFGWKLYVLVIAVLLGAMYVTMLGYRFFDVLPVLVNRLVAEAGSFFATETQALELNLNDRIRKLVEEGKLAEPFRAGDIPFLKGGSKSFLAKHCEGNGRYTEYFVRVDVGLYKLKR